jgi:2-keto-3-deoxy-L-fuconate dehydrogenase
MRLANKTVLVTAAGQGIGHASVLAMAAEGATVWATDVNPALLKSFAGQDRIHTATLDVMDKAGINALVMCTATLHWTLPMSNGISP